MKQSPLRSYYITLVIAILACAAAYAGICLIQLGAPTGLTEFTDAYALVQERIATRTGKKLLYAGGSSGFYGVRCEDLSRQIGRPAVNFGLHGGLGLRYLMDRVVTASGPGDVIVIGPEWETYRGPRFGEYACDYIMSRRPRYLESLPLSLATKVFIAAGPQRIFSGFLSRLLNETLPSRDTDVLASVNTNGDRVITPVNIEQQSVFAKNLTADVPQWQSPPQELTPDVEAFVKACHKKGVRVVAVFPPLCLRGNADKGMIAATEEGMRRFWADQGIVVLGTFENASYEGDDAFDTPYHLVASAAIIHTTKLARLLKVSGILAE